MKRMRVSIFQRSFSTLLLGAGGSILGAAIILFGYPFPGDDVSREFVEQPEFLLWLVLVMISTALSAVLAGPLWRSLRSLKEPFDRNKLDIILSTIVAFLLFIMPIPIARAISKVPLPPLKYHPQKIASILVIAFLAFLPAIVGIWLIRAAVQSSLPNIEPANKETDQLSLVKQYARYRRLLQRYLSILGIMIGMIVLTTGALRNVEIAGDVPEDKYPLTIVLAYGLYYTMLLALVYFPTHLSLVGAGRKLRDRIYPLDSLESLVEDDESRKKLDEFLQLKLSTEQSLRTGIAILTPLLSGLLSSVLG